MKQEADVALRVTVPLTSAEVVGAVLMERLGPFAEVPADATGAVTLIFYPGTAEIPSVEGLLASLPRGAGLSRQVRIERREVPRDWVEGWRDHFHPVHIGRVRVRPPWEPPLAAPGSAVDVVINPGLGFGTGLHPTTRGTLTLLQSEVECGEEGSAALGPLVDAGTGSGILSVAAAKLGWRPILAFDNDALALAATRENLAANGVAKVVEVRECGVEEAEPSWFHGATVLANMTLDPVLTLIRRLRLPRAASVAGEDPARCPKRLVVSGILAGAQEAGLVAEAERCGYLLGPRLYEDEWVSMGFVPRGSAGAKGSEELVAAPKAATAEGV